jgi:hypothetical protein
MKYEAKGRFWYFLTGLGSDLLPHEDSALRAHSEAYNLNLR